ncbi:hypothetical protein CA54_53840 [Symmachiella macrocystis]|uniref:Ice-binding protein C-terminal domain-containing protein n=1 Tax=Symmachiella macrocystis TaxID=2527985 RepID=A0A5C6B4W9_9PLAN|nr:PEP-CTERM sorting domain-containing protein [Symmachiella macrocystis]TWU06980.1 hypothetical protein CA54_53840 [Symmachiella macrocystis]
MKRWIGISVACVALVVVAGKQVQAEIITTSFTGTVINPLPYAGTTGIGTFSYDDAGLTGIGPEIVAAPSGLMIDFTIFGQTFTQLDDIQYNAFPQLTLLEGVPDYLDFVIDEISTPIDEPNVLAIRVQSDLTPDGLGGYTADVNLVITPEPSTYAGLLGIIGVSLLAYGWRRRKQAV